LSRRTIRFRRPPAALGSVRIVEELSDGPEIADPVQALAAARGYARGLAEGVELARSEAAGRLDEAAAAVESAREEAARSLARTAAELGVEIARRLLRTEVSIGRHDLEAMVRESLQAAGAGREECVVHLHPDDVESLKDVHFRSLTRIEADSGIARGDVHVETRLGCLVRELDESLEAIGDRLRQELS